MSKGQQMPGIPDIIAQPFGILSATHADNPLFADWNHVYLWYCTSDSHLGELRHMHDLHQYSPRFHS